MNARTKSSNSFRAGIKNAGYGELDIIKTVEITVEGGELLVVLGANGAGKSTTLGALIGTVRSRDRIIELDGDDLSSLPAWALARRGVILVPDGARCFPSLSVQENLQGSFVATTAGGSEADFKRLLEEQYALFPILRDFRAKAAGRLSGGQRQMLAVSRALMARPRTLILDEPSAGLSPKVTEELFEGLAAIKRERGASIILAEQNVAIAAEMADRCIVLEDGRVALQGPMEEVAKSERLRAAYLGL